MTAVQTQTGTPSLAGTQSAAITGTGRIYFWQGGSLWTGRGMGRTQWHAHHAHQLALALRGSVRFRGRQEGAWTDFDGALVPSESTHQFEIDGTAVVAHLFVEPESTAGRALTARFGARTVVALPPDDFRAAAEVLTTALETEHGDTGAIVAAARSAIATLSGAAGAATTATPAATDEPDPRLARALEFIRANIRRPIALGDVASVVALSESRFRHLFVAGTGTSFRAYLLWLRINLAIEAVSAGASWTEAAHEAGFADSAHLTRTHKRMFGIEPTAIRRSPASFAA